MNDKYTLLVEDNPDDVILTQMALKKSQLRNKLVVVRDGEEALDFLFCRGQYAGRDSNDTPALILLDLNLPRVDGLEVLDQIRANKNTSHLPVVVLTSSTEDSDRTKSDGLGADDYIRKPTGFYQFVQIIQEINSRWLSSNGS